MSMPGTPYNGGPFERIRSLSVTVRIFFFFDINK